ncbi:GGDEF domain-containing protein [Rheinheimera fenheensis]|uniref:GGDEF domain-containing protein n=1 Tax=Rheinheimera fenheensis TaxID=3152295 RepID=UPI00325CB355
MQPLITSLPLALIMLLLWQWPAQAASISALFPAAVYLLLSFTAVLASLMRQWHWLYCVTLLASHYFVVQHSLQQSLAEPVVASLYLVLPVAFTLLWLLLQWQSKPQLLTVQGVSGLLLLASALPVVWQLLPPLTVLQQTVLPLWLQPVSNQLHISWGSLWWMALVACAWAGILSFKAAAITRWAQFSVWLAIMLFYIFVQQPFISGWMTLAASLTLLLSLSNQMLQLAYIDELTQLPQRRALLAHLSRLGRRSAVTMLDVDHFKKFNDTYGHDVGDQVLKLLGAVLGSEKGLSAYRYGGEEFTLVFSHNNHDKLADKLEQVRERVASYPLVIRQQDRPKDSKTGKQQRGNSNGNKTVHVTISLGCAVRQRGETTKQLLKRADEALYQAKRAGRNQVVIAN